MDEVMLARLAARSVASQWWGEHPQTPQTVIPVRQLIEQLGLWVSYLDPQMYPGTLGYLDPDGDNIWIKPDLATGVERFTLAHELGHHQLHLHNGRYEDDCQSEAISHLLHDADNAAILRPDEAYSPRSRRERQANAFAAELLAPLELVQQLYLEDRGRYRRRTTTTIAKECDVSKSVIIAQLTQLLVHEPTDISVSSRPTDTLDDRQQAAVVCPTPALIVAGPGTGKTSTLVGRVRWLTQQGIPAERILALTFSRKATFEMQERIAQALGPGNKPTVTTFHRFGGDLLQRYGYKVGLQPDFQLVDEIAGFFLLRDHAADLPLVHYASLSQPTRHYADLLRAISSAKDELIEPDGYAQQAATFLATATDEKESIMAERWAEVAQVYAVYQRELERLGAADYADLIRLTVKLFTEEPDILATVRAQYDAVLVDEFQDINRANGILLRYLAGPEGNIWAVGDANQAIYQFRGASPMNIVDFTKDYPQAAIVTLDHNYRSRPAIVAAANRFIADQLPPAGAMPLVTLQANRTGTANDVQMYITPTSDDEIATVVAGIIERHSQGIPYRDQAVLCRTNSLARKLATVLREQSVPASAMTSLFEATIIKNVLGIVHLLAGEKGGLLRTAQVSSHQLQRATVDAILQEVQQEGATLSSVIAEKIAEQPPHSDQVSLQRMIEILAKMSVATSISKALSAYIFDDTAIARYALRVAPDDAIHLAELLAIANRYDLERPAPTHDQPETAALLRWADFMIYLRTLRGLGARIEATAPHGQTGGNEQVPVLTVHGAKGLEWPVVYLPELATTYFPKSRQHSFAPPLPQPGRQAEEERKQEEARLFYVAVTRARDTLVLSRAQRYGKVARKPSPFLAPILMDKTITTVTVGATDRKAESTSDDESGMTTFAITQLGTTTANALATYADCPRKYLYRYGYRLEASRGNYWRLRHAVSTSLRDTYREQGDAAGAIARFEAIWQEQATQDSFAAFDEMFLVHGRKSVAATMKHLQYSGQTEPTRTQFAQLVAVAVDDIIIKVELDRIDSTIIDNKSTQLAVRHQMEARKRQTKFDMRLYLTLLAHRSLTGDTTADTLLEHELPTGVVVPLTINAATEATLSAELHQAITGIQSGSFPAAPEPMRCSACEFVFICPL